MSDWSDFAADCGISANDPEGIDKLIDMWADDGEDDDGNFICGECGYSHFDVRRFVMPEEICTDCYYEEEE